MEGWQALFAPARTPPEVVDRIAAATAELLAEPATREQLEALGMTPGRLARADLPGFLAAERGRYAAIIRDGNITLDQGPPRRSVTPWRTAGWRSATSPPRIAVCQPQLRAWRTSTAGRVMTPSVARRLDTRTRSGANSTRQPSRWAMRRRVERTDQSVRSKAGCMRPG